MMTTTATPETRTPGAIAGYSIKNFRASSAGPEGGAFTATIYRGTKAILKVENDGWGGSHRYTDPKSRINAVAPGAGDGYDELKQLETTARRVMGAEESEFFEADMFLELIIIAQDLQKHADKHGYTYEAVAAASVPRMDYLDDRHREILIHPEVFSA